MILKKKNIELNLILFFPQMLYVLMYSFNEMQLFHIKVLWALEIVTKY